MQENKIPEKLKLETPGLTALALAMKTAFVALCEGDPYHTRYILTLFAITTMIPDLIKDVKKRNMETEEYLTTDKRQLTYTEIDTYYSGQQRKLWLLNRNMGTYELIMQKLEEHGITQKMLQSLWERSNTSSQAIW